MILTLPQIISLGASVQEDAQALAKKLDDAMTAINLHNAQKGAARIEAGMINVAQGGLHTAIEQIANHIKTYTPPESKP